MTEEELRIRIAAMPVGEERSSFEMALEGIVDKQGPERAAALEQLSMDYEGRGDALKDDLTMAYDQYSTPTAEGDTGPSGNPYAVSIAASPLEHLAVGMQKYQGAKDIKATRGKREALSKSQEAGMQQYQAAIIKEMEEERLRKARQGGSFLPSWFTGK